MSKNKGWIGVDFDGTVAHYGEWAGDTHVGEPIPAMVDRIKAWIADGWEVRIVTARAGGRGRAEAIDAIRQWTRRHIGVALEVTCSKDYEMVALYDDRAVQVEKNTGRVLGEEPEWLKTTGGES